MRNLIFFLTVLMSIMLFISNPLDETVRLYQSVWNTGHLFFFALLTALLITHTPLQNQSAFKMLLASVLFSLVLGGVIEVVQLLVGRYMEWSDLWQDVLGGSLGFLAVQFFKSKEQRFAAKPIIVVISVGILLVAFYPVYNVVQDDFEIKSAIPMIADFESDETLLRWDNMHVAEFSLDTNIRRKGQSSARVKFDLGDYPTVTLLALYADWSAYNFLNLSVHNDQSDNLDIEVKVYDRQHRKNGLRYADRFNYEVTIKPGWNEIKIRLMNIRNAPESRIMDLYNIAGLSLFISDPDEQKIIHLDNIHLSK